LYQIHNKELKSVWLKAAVMGSLWASFEIIVGSFLHNLHLPFSGTALTFASVLMVIAFAQFWNDKGLVWRAGVICALMKSLSPSAVILGPMIGIMTEAFIIEFFLRITGRNLFSYMAGGGIAVASALVHKVVSLLILYGWDLVKIFDGMYQYALRQLKISQLDPAILITILVLIYIIAGFVAALLGYVTGKKFKKRVSGQPARQEITLENRNSLFNVPGRNRYSLALLFGHVIALVVCLWLINSVAYYYFLPVSIVYLAGCFAWYKRSLRYLKKFSFWIQVIIITLLAAFLLEGYTSGNYFSVDGLVIGLKMNLRAFLIMAGFTAISSELKNPLIRSILFNKGFASLYQSLSLAFSALPGIIAGLPNSGKFFRKRYSVLEYLFQQSEALLAQFHDSHVNRPPVLIISGDVGQGKTTFSRSLAKGLMERGITVSGFFSVGIQENEMRTGFDLEDIKSGGKMVISRNSLREGWIRQNHYYFDPDVFRKESEMIWHQLTLGAQLLIMDEIGPLELNDTGWSPLVEAICRDHPIPMIWIVRKKLIQKVARKWNTGDVYVFTLGNDREDDIFDIIKRMTDK
jgi:nucleoside-triphosphatase THEP1